jgi:cytochrome c-type biogenesis protein CcmF
MTAGDTVTVGGYIFRLNSVREVQGPNYVAARGEVEVIKNSESIEKMYPEKRSYLASGNAMTETAINTGLFRDLYVSLGEPLGDGAWSVRVYYKPFVDWIWGGAVLMALGGGLALSDRRYLLAARKERQVKTIAGTEDSVPSLAAASVQAEP